MPIACLTGVTGQIGSYVCELLLEKEYRVYGLKRRSSSLNTERLDHVFDHPNLELVYGDVTDYASVCNFISSTMPDIFINCAAQSHVRVSFDTALYTFQATGASVFNCLEAIRIYSPSTAFITMSSSEMFGSTPPPQNEDSVFHPRSPYAVAKLAGYYATINYRDMGIFASNAICFNTESPRRGETFVTRKIIKAAARIKYKLQNKLHLGNLNSSRDFTHAKDTADALLKIVTHEQPDDFVIASGEMHTIQKFVEIVFSKLDLDYKDHIEFDPRLVRPTEVDALCGDSTKLRKVLNWIPKYTFNMIIDEMIDSEMKLARRELLVNNA